MKNRQVQVILFQTVANGAVGTAVSKKITQPFKIKQMVMGVTTKNILTKCRMFMSQTDEAPTEVGDSGLNLLQAFGNIDYLPAMNLQNTVDINDGEMPTNSYLKLQTENGSGASVSAMMIFVIELLPRKPKGAKIEP